MISRSFRTVLPLTILLVEIISVGATIYGYRAMQKSAAESDNDHFLRLVDSQMSEITARLGSYESILYGGVGFLNGSEEVSADEWRRYVESIQLQQMAPGVLGMGTISPVPASERERMLEEFRRIRGEAFVYKTVNDVPPPENGSYVIERIEPLEKNRKALGLDIGSESNRRMAFEAARDSGTPQITGIVSLVQHDQKIPGFLLMIPRYRSGAPLDTMERRRAAFLDVIYAPMIGKDILRLPSKRKSSEIAFAVYDEQLSPDRLIFSNDSREGFNPQMKQTLIWPYAGRKWLIHTWSTERFISKVDSKSIKAFLAIGVMFNAMLAVILVMIHRRHRETLSKLDEFHNQADERSHINDLFVKHAPAAIAIFDERLCYLAASTRWLQAFDLKQNIIGKHHYDVFHEIQNEQKWLQIHQRCLAGESLSSDQDYFIRGDGRRMIMKWEIHPWKKNDGKVGGIIMFAQDITEEVESRQKLLDAQKDIVATEKRLRQATTAGKVGIWDYQIAKDCLVWNDQMHDFFGTSPESFRGCFEDFERAISPEDLPKLVEFIQGAAEDQTQFEIECRPVRDEQRTILAMGNVERDESGNAVRMLGVCVDVTERTRIFEELERARDQHAKARHEAEKLARAKQQFLATMSHEMRTPMNGVIGMSELLLTTHLDPEQEDYAQTISHCGRSLMTLINDILDLSKIEAGGLVLEAKPFEPVEVMDRAVRVISKQVSDKQLVLERHVDPDVPDKIIGDENRLRQVLLNLYSNAIKFTAKGAIRVDCRVSELTATDVELLFSVKDDGVGMSEESLAKVFLPFVQADASTTRKYGGTGLGLSISKSLVELMGGRLTLESQLGVGTTAVVRVRFPLATPHHPVQPNQEAVSPVVIEHPNWFDRVMIVEDNPINQRVTQLQMKKFCKQIDIAGDGSQAVRLFQENHYDLILMDCQMPVMDGFDATMEIRRLEQERQCPRTPIMALTANVSETDKQRAFVAGMDAFLPKPLRLESLVSELEKIRLR